ncbi:hypothetical protein [Streptomyces triticiradicis]|uniref:Uncharacterized protein n=1 Tax=Streptomyces triticiradicis TaxID=2651189 RepID=A0A7J5DM26_9ACTN|nr:hypothetical protein [Streptomyces triticiradicis]KAB1989782.1 hypothetical protein F8144_05390 [Streptomyces triticiradicis]
MGRRLAAAVHVQHPTSREWIVLEPGDEPDDQLAAEITNPDAWEDVDPSAELEESEPDEPKKDEPRKDEPQPFGFAGPPPEPEAEPAPPAPRRRRKPAEADA